MILEQAAINLERYAQEQYNARVKTRPLTSMRGFMAASLIPDGPTTITLTQQLSDQERVYMLTHMLAHMVLGHHERMAATILEPSFSADSERAGPARIDSWELEQHQRAKTLTRLILRGEVDSRWQDHRGELDDNINHREIADLQNKARQIRAQIAPLTLPDISDDKW